MSEFREGVDGWKPIVQYKALRDADLSTDLIVGQRAWVIPLDHPSYLVRNGFPAIVSVIKYVGEDGYFETNNTRYVRVGG